MQPFAHLHVHSEYSLLDASAKISELAARAKEMGMDSLAITDHGVMFGVIDFYKACRGAGVKPILGCEVYVAPQSRLIKERRDEGTYHHLVLLAENEEGYHNLVRLVSLGFVEGFYYKPRVDMELLQQYSKGLIALSACQSGVVSKILLTQGYEAGKARAIAYNELFGQDNFYLELQNHGLEDQQMLNPMLMQISQETGIPMVVTNDVHYIEPSDNNAHDILLCIQTQKTVLDEDRMIYGSDQFYLKSPEEMYQLFPHAKEALANSQKIADRCHIDIEFNNYKLPIFDVPHGRSAAEHLDILCKQGLEERYGQDAHLHQERLDYELDVIRGMGFVDYFLIVSDFIKYARDNGIMVGPGRGSGAGSIVAFVLRITDVDPIPYNLLFERFLNPERVSMPDFDIDFCYERRQEVIDYVVRKYGTEQVSQIITFGTMKAKAATRDVGRALAMSYGEVDRVAKMIPPDLGMTLGRALDMNPELKAAYRDEPDTRKLIDMSMRLEGLPRHSSTHAAGVVICDKPVMEYVPLNTNDGLITTQFPKDTVEELGLLKFDFLGLRTLTVIRIAAEEVFRSRGIKLDIYHWDYNDPNVYDMISHGKTSGVFQIESSGMTSFMKELQPESIEDLTAGISLYRPGPMDFIPKYIKGKRDPSNVTYMHEKLKPILEATYGCIVYQEQVMQIVRDLAGYSLGRSDLMRRAMSKKIADVMEKERQHFVHGLQDGDINIPGCIKNGVPEKAANKIFDAMTEFAAYAFNKSHGAAYSYITYQTAWLKYYYPVEFMAAIMTSVMDSSDKVSAYIRECKNMEIAILPPDINSSAEGHSRGVADGASASVSRPSLDGGGLEAASVEKSVGRKLRPTETDSAQMESAPVSGHETNTNAHTTAQRGTPPPGGIRFGLASIKNVGRGVVDAIVKEREANGKYKSISDFIRRLSGHDLNKRCLESLIRCGAFDSLGGKRSQYIAVYANIMDGLAQTKKTTLSGQLSLFDMGGPEEEAQTDHETDELPNIPEFPTRLMLQDEKELLGVYVSGHPLAEYEATLRQYTSTTSIDLQDPDSDDEESETPKIKDGDKIKYGGMITGKSVKYTKKDNKPFCFLTVEDMYGAVEILVFPQAYEKFSSGLNADQVLVVQGKISKREDEATKIVAEDMLFYEEMPYVSPSDAAAPSSPPQPPKIFWIKIPKTSQTPLRNITEILQKFPGKTPVIIYDEARNQKHKANANFWVTITDGLIMSLEGLLGQGVVKIV
ncbi:MAG: DNA polymerase III subunit alpha [Defluviitaleaceae bacterium]|nr:DNA polymerase III subunit alpha [Defluviitaleaceae bacterium]